MHSNLRLVDKVLDMSYNESMIAWSEPEMDTDSDAE